MHRALIVAAVSTAAQAADDKASIPRQIEDCRAVCAKRGWEVVGEITIPGHSRAYNYLAELVVDCPEYGQLIKMVASGQITLIVAWAYDRLWRTDALRAQVTAYCREHRVQVYALNQPSEPTEDGSIPFVTRASETIFGLFSENEKDSIARRSKAGRENLVRQGYSQYSGGNAPFGYRKVIGSNILEVVPSEARLVRWIYNRRAIDRWNYSHIRNVLSDRNIPTQRGAPHGWRVSVIIHILSNTVYKGAVHFGSVECEQGRHEAIVSPLLWEQAQNVPPTYEHIIYDHFFLLKGICRCGFCSYAMTYSYVSPTRNRLQCSYYTSHSARMCRANYHNAAMVEAFVLDAIAEAGRSPDEFLRQRAHTIDTRSDAELLERELSELETRYHRWDDAYEVGQITLDELADHRKRLTTRITELRQQITSQSEQEHKRALVEQRLAKLMPLADMIHELPPEEQRGYVLDLVEKIILEQGNPPRIIWR